MLIEEPKHHWLVIAPANSPENHFTMPDGRDASIAIAPTMSQQLTRYLFNACIDSSKILGIDEQFRRELIDKRARLAPTQIGSDGRIMEWLEEYKEPEPHHRHVSHLWSLYPGNEISPDTTPDFAKAAGKSLEVRGDDGVGWSLAVLELCSGLASVMAIMPRSWCRKRSVPLAAWKFGMTAAAAFTPTCSTPALHFKLTEISAPPRRSRKCCFRVATGKSVCYPRYQTHGKMEPSLACALAEDLKWRWFGKPDNWFQ